MPDKAQEREREGSAVVYVTIAGDGSVSDVVIAQENPEGYGFGAAAKSAVLKWEFAPGQPGKYAITMPSACGLPWT